MNNSNGNLTIYPLFWVYHDFWNYTQSIIIPNRDKPIIKHSPYQHKGHIHFFIPNFSVEQATTQQAYTGRQVYSYNLNQIWSPNLQNENQLYNNRVVGKPKWYFYIQQYWRRIYIQPWQSVHNNQMSSDFLGKKGIKFDASLPQHTRGIFRQGKDNYFFYTDLCRTLPIQYWHNRQKTIRDHYLRLNNQNDQYNKYYKNVGAQKWKVGLSEISNPIWNFGQRDENGNFIQSNTDNSSYPKLIDGTKGYEYGIRQNYWDYYTHVDQFTIPRKYQCKGNYIYNTDTDMTNDQPQKVKKDVRHLSWSDEDGARCNYADRYYIYPTIQYQKVIHKNFERLDGYEDRDLEDQETGENFGDGYEYEISIPFTREINGNKIIQSPFSDDQGKVYPPGSYFHGVVKDQNKLRYRRQKYENSQSLKYNDYQIALAYKKPRQRWCYPSDQQLVFNDALMTQWNLPTGYPQDGIWVEQCLGAIVKAKVKVITEDFLGGRTVNWIQDTVFSTSDPFEGMEI